MISETALLKREIHNELIKMKKKFKQAKVQTMNKLVKEKKKMELKINDAKEETKISGKVEKMKKMIFAIKKLRPEITLQFCLDTDLKRINQILGDANESYINKAKAKLALHKSLQSQTKLFSEKYPDSDEIRRLVLTRIMKSSNNLNKKLAIKREEKLKNKNQPSNSEMGSPSSGQIESLETNESNENSPQKSKKLNGNSPQKIEILNGNSPQKIEILNENSPQKRKILNENSPQKRQKFNENSQQKRQKFNENSSEKEKKTFNMKNTTTNNKRYKKEEIFVKNNLNNYIKKEENISTNKKDIFSNNNKNNISESNKNQKTYKNEIKIKKNENLKEKPIHPSWEAKRNMKEKLATSFQGTKIKFED